MSKSLDERLDTALKKRADLEARKQRLEGKLEAARKSLADVEEECRQKGVEPAALDETIKKLGQRYETLVSSLEQEVEKAVTALSPYLVEA